MTTAQIEARNVLPDAMSQNLGKDEFVAVDGSGRVVSRANSREAVELAAPHHSGIFSAGELKHLGQAPEPIDGTPGPTGAEATALPSDNSFEKILAHVEKTRDSEAVHERQLKDAETVIKATEDAKPEGQKKAEAEAAENKNPTSPVKKTADGEIVPNKFDHDGNGASGGSQKGDDSTAHKGAAKRAAAKTKNSEAADTPAKHHASAKK